MRQRFLIQLVPALLETFTFDFLPHTRMMHYTMIFSAFVLLSMSIFSCTTNGRF